MSHLKERKEKNCLNCNAQVHGKYCHICGQENIEPKESAWHLVSHFFQDITHFDGKFFSTIKYLVFKPGFISREYVVGRRASYLNPIRMYVFTSALFFLVFFSINKENDDIVKTTYNGKTEEQVAAMDSATFNAFTKEITKAKAMTRQDFEIYKDSTGRKRGIHFATSHYKNKAAYDSALRSGEANDNWIERKLAYKEIEVNEKYHNNSGLITNAFVDNLKHSFPQMLFVSLPLFALILKLLYFRRKTYYYANHIIFGIHLYVFVFIQLLIIIGLAQLHHVLDWGIFNFLIVAISIYMFYYAYKSMRNFYQQRRGKTILKFILLNIMMLIVIGLLFTVFIFFSLLKI